MGRIGTRIKGFRSKFEKEVADRLKKLRIRVKGYETVTLPYVLKRKYTSDFELKDGTLLEVKGVLLYDDRAKMKAVKEQHPDKRIVFVFMNPKRRVPRLKMTHAEWAEKHGFEWLSIDQLKELK